MRAGGKGEGMHGNWPMLMNGSSFLKINEAVNKSLGSWHIVINMHRQMNK